MVNTSGMFSTELTFCSALKEPADLFQDLASIEIVAMLNEAFCELHHKPYCPASQELSRECGKVRLIPQLRTTCACGWSFRIMHFFVMQSALSSSTVVVGC